MRRHVFGNTPWSVLKCEASWRPVYDRAADAPRSAPQHGARTLAYRRCPLSDCTKGSGEPVRSGRIPHLCPVSHRSTRPHKAPKGPRTKLWSSPLWGTKGGERGNPTPTSHLLLSRLLCLFACFTTYLAHNSKKTNTVVAISNCLSISNLLYFLRDRKPSF